MRERMRDFSSWERKVWVGGVSGKREKRGKRRKEMK